MSLMSLMKLIPLLVTRIHKHCFSPEIVAASSFNQSDALSAFSELWQCLIAVARYSSRFSSVTQYVGITIFKMGICPEQAALSIEITIGGYANFIARRCDQY